MHIPFPPQPGRIVAKNEADKSRFDSPDVAGDQTPPRRDILDDGMFAIKVSEEMGLRNLLRAGLVEAQGKDDSRIPMFVSWPPWLEDGIVCLFARDLHALIRKIVRDTAVTITSAVDFVQVTEQDAAAIEAVAEQASFESLASAAPAVPRSGQPVVRKPVAKAPAPAAPSKKKPDPQSGPTALQDDQELADLLFSELRNQQKKK